MKMRCRGCLRPFNGDAATEAPRRKPMCPSCVTKILLAQIAERSKVKPQ